MGRLSPSRLIAMLGISRQVRAMRDFALASRVEKNVPTRACCWNCSVVFFQKLGAASRRSVGRNMVARMRRLLHDEAVRSVVHACAFALGA